MVIIGASAPMPTYTTGSTTPIYVVDDKEFQKVLTAYKQFFNCSSEVTWGGLSLGEADPITGWYEQLYTDSTVDMAIVQKEAQRFALNLGYWVSNDALGFTDTALAPYDLITDAFDRVWEIKTCKPQPTGNKIKFFVYDLKELPCYEPTPTYGTGASVDDPRYRTKTWLDTYITGTNLKHNDGSTNATYITHWKDPPYVMDKVFWVKGIDLCFSVGRGKSKPVIDSDHYCVGYEESISIFPSAVDKVGVSGENLMWQGERELRRIAEEQPLGSIRNFETMNPATVNLGSTTLYTVECVLYYERDTD